jgi:hypothetical protein
VGDVIGFGIGRVEAWWCGLCFKAMRMKQNYILFDLIAGFGQLAALVAFSVTVQAAPPQTVIAQKIVSHLPQVLPQKRTPWCFAFAARTVLSQFTCAKTGRCLEADKIAVANFIRAYQAGKPGFKSDNAALDELMDSWWSGGDSATALKYMTEKHAVLADSACTHEKELFEYGDLTQLSLSYLLRGTLENFQENRKANPGLSALQFVNEHKVSPEIRRIVNFMLPALERAKTFAQFSEMALLPKRCVQRSALAITPKFHVGQVKLTDPAKIEAQIEQVLNTDSMVGINICAGVLDPSIGDCGAHATAIAGYRTVCGGNKGECEKQYLFYDSSFFLSQGRNADGSFWVPARLLTEATIALIKDSKMDIIKKTYSEDMENILADTIANRNRIIAEYQANRNQVIADSDARNEKIITDALNNPGLDTLAKRILERDLRMQMAKSRADLEQAFPAVPDMTAFDQAIADIRKMIDESLKMSLFNDNNLYWLER